MLHAMILEGYFDDSSDDQRQEKRKIRKNRTLGKIRVRRGTGQAIRIGDYFWGFFSADVTAVGATPGVFAFGLATAITGLGFQKSAATSAIWSGG